MVLGSVQTREMVLGSLRRVRGTVGAALWCTSGMVGMESLQGAGQGGISGLAGAVGVGR